MKCPNCCGRDTLVVDSRPLVSGAYRKRRYECKACGIRFNTLETYQDTYAELGPDSPEKGDGFE